MLRERPRGRLLEIGCGAGALIRDLNGAGFECIGLELGEAAREVACRICADRNVEIHGTASAAWQGSFDYVAAFEVLEHIDDHEATARAWRDWLKPSGKLLISVPAHPKKWDASDVWAGHFRRYTRESLTEVLAQAGLAIEYLETWGFPLANAIAPVRALANARRLRARGDSATDKHHGSVNSGIERGVEAKLFPLQASWLGVKVMQACFGVQKAFSHTELGTGYLAVASRR
jgi:SAM-dependent methyltransferase